MIIHDAARRKLDRLCRTTFERISARQDEESFALRKEMQHLSQTFSGRIYALESSVALVKQELTDNKEYTRTSIMAIRDEMKSGRDELKLTMVVERMSLLEARLKSSTIGAENDRVVRHEKNSRELEAKMDDKLNFWYDLMCCNVIQI